MPFLEHFGLTDYPFGLTPNAELYYPTKETEAVLAALEFSLMRGDGLLKVVGEVGTGKTLMCRLLLKKMESQPVSIAYINAPIAFKPEQLPGMIASEFGLKVKAGDPLPKLRDFLIKQHGKGIKNILVVDEAQALAVEGLETVRLLSNLETETDKLLQIVLFGQPELDMLLKREDMRQLLQRVQFAFDLKPLTPEIVSDYVRYRIEGCVGEPEEAPKPKKKKTTSDPKKKKTKSKSPKVQIKMKPQVPVARFEAKAFALLARASGGIPRLINTLADKALMAAYAEGQTTITRRHVRLACRETEGVPFPWSWIARFF